MCLAHPYGYLHDHEQAKQLENEFDEKKNTSFQSGS